MISSNWGIGCENKMPPCRIEQIGNWNDELLDSAEGGIFFVGKNILVKFEKPLDYLVIIGYTVFTIKSCKIYIKSCGINRIAFLIISIYFIYLAISFYSRISFV